MSGTRGAQTASAQMTSLGWKSSKRMNPATPATSAAHIRRPHRWSGTVFGSEIIRKVKMSRVPEASSCAGMVIGSPSHRARPKRMAT